MRHSKLRLTLFFIAQALAVAAMCFVVVSGRGDGDNRFAVVASNATILVELGMIAAALNVNRSAWQPTLAVGFMFLVLGAIQILVRTTCDPGGVTFLNAWHLATGLLLVGAVVLSGVVVLLAGLRRFLVRCRATQPRAA
jgi:hypothetical protein